VKDCKLAVEYQGEQHYWDITVYDPAQHTQAMDQLKAAKCGLEGITLVEVPFWALSRLDQQSKLTMLQAEIKTKIG